MASSEGAASASEDARASRSGPPSWTTSPRSSQIQTLLPMIQATHVSSSEESRVSDPCPLALRPSSTAVSQGSSCLCWDTQHSEGCAPLQPCSGFGKIRHSGMSHCPRHCCAEYLAQDTYPVVNLPWHTQQSSAWCEQLLTSPWCLQEAASLDATQGHVSHTRAGTSSPATEAQLGLIVSSCAEYQSGLFELKLFALVSMDPGSSACPPGAPRPQLPSQLLGQCLSQPDGAWTNAHTVTETMGHSTSDFITEELWWKVRIPGEAAFACLPSAPCTPQGSRADPIPLTRTVMAEKSRKDTDEKSRMMLWMLTWGTVMPGGRSVLQLIRMGKSVMMVGWSSSSILLLSNSSSDSYHLPDLPQSFIAFPQDSQGVEANLQKQHFE
ncbi:hypothetical protein EK904_002965 [Melospiza melodia maxima]|nr:hypothetical protein EK904_002965 [Melospiza melodia maxima]